MNSENSKTTDSHRLLLNLSDKIHLRSSDICIPLSNLSIYYTLKNIKRSNKNNKSKIYASRLNEKFKLSDGSYSVSDIQDYFGYIIKKYKTVTYNSPVRIQVNKIENRITFKTKKGFFLQFLTPETMKLLGRTKSKINKDKNS